MQEPLENHGKNENGDSSGTDRASSSGQSHDQRQEHEGRIGASESNIHLPPEVSGFVNRYIATAKYICLSPRVFFETMPQTGGFKEPALFLVAGSAVFAVLNSLITLKPFDMFLLFIVAAGYRTLAALVALGCARAMGVKNAQFEAIFRVYAYSSCLAVVGWVPIVGFLIEFVYGLVLVYFGFRRVLGSGTAQTAALVFVSMVFSGLAMGVFFLINLLAGIVKSIFGG